MASLPSSKCMNMSSSGSLNSSLPDRFLPQINHLQTTNSVSITIKYMLIVFVYYVTGQLGEHTLKYLMNSSIVLIMKHCGRYYCVVLDLLCLFSLHSKKLTTPNKGRKSIPISCIIPGAQKFWAKTRPFYHFYCIQVFLHVSEFVHFAGVISI